MTSMVDTRPVEAPEAAHRFRVWMRPMGLSWKIAVEAGYEAKWLTKRLAEHGYDSVDFVQDADDLHCTFRCLTTDRFEKESVEKLLNQWPEVKLQLNPEYSSGKVKVEVSPHLSPGPLHRPAHPKTVASDVEPFRVWIRPLGNAWKVRIEGADSSQWLRNELEHRGLTCSNSSQIADTCMQTFRCMSETPHESSYVWNLLKALPQVLLQNDPA
jgi:hypothetical protein